MIENTEMTSEGSKVTLRRLLSPKNPAKVMVASAITLAIVPASVDRRPPLYVPRESLDDMTRESSDKLTPGINDILSKRSYKSISYLQHLLTLSNICACLARK
jgi:hypothetical protein